MSTIANQPLHGNSTTLNYLIDSLQNQTVYLKLSNFTPSVEFINSVIGNDLDTNHSFSTRENAIFKNCEQIGNITAVGTIILKNCAQHGKVMSLTGNIHVLNSSTENLIPGPGKKIYVYEEGEERNTRRKLF